MEYTNRSTIMELGGYTTDQLLKFCRFFNLNQLEQLILFITKDITHFNKLYAIWYFFRFSLIFHATIIKQHHSHLLIVLHSVWVNVCWSVSVFVYRDTLSAFKGNDFCKAEDSWYLKGRRFISPFSCNI